LIIARKKAFEDILKALENDKSVFVLGCGECATVTETGGEKQALEMKARLEEAGKTVTGVDVAPVTCQELDVKRVLRRNGEAVEKADAFLVLSCGAGVQSVREATTKHVTPGTDSIFVGNIKRAKSYEERCNLCGECLLDEYGAICPVTRCPKGLLNGPCGGTNHGKCEVDPDKDCAWVLIHKQLKSEGRVDALRRIHSPKNWNSVPRPGHVGPQRRAGEK
jgi:hypothetical protein